MNDLVWPDVTTRHSISYRCGYCSQPLASEKGWDAMNPIGGAAIAHIRICHRCGRPTFIDKDESQTPGALFGDAVSDIPDKAVEELYDEARRAYSSRSYTAAVLVCRKLLMHIAVAKGAAAEQNFVFYVEYLANNHYILFCPYRNETKPTII